MIGDISLLVRKKERDSIRKLWAHCPHNRNCQQLSEKPLELGNVKKKKSRNKAGSALAAKIERLANGLQSNSDGKMLVAGRVEIAGTIRKRHAMVVGIKKD